MTQSDNPSPPNPPSDTAAGAVTVLFEELSDASSTPDRSTERAYEDLDMREYQQVLDHRDKFADHAYGFTQTWIGFLIVLTFAQFLLKPLGYGLSEAEFITVFTTTTASVFGFGVLVGNFLFPKGGSKRRREK